MVDCINEIVEPADGQGGSQAWDGETHPADGVSKELRELYEQDDWIVKMFLEM